MLWSDTQKLPGRTAGATSGCSNTGASPCWCDGVTAPAVSDDSLAVLLWGKYTAPRLADRVRRAPVSPAARLLADLPPHV